ncbi:formate dehydrogenase subunit alpha [Paludifilum halophilum]|uniref:Formate dehydrogenase subunit alpha n=1 Tax=Paludifilum halophilum TaxID=1642702 RepID=A0A235B3Z4_9BACL|nr:formate dehydrogenase subunit alpha [Paludifilum halophilum]OYD07046.1 formate dehydrogenase subunit alpha [Paludifilum halophilum]
MKTVMDFLRDQGIEVPHLCYHPSLGPIQTCDLCLVSADGKLVRACAEPYREGMTIETGSEAVKAVRMEAMDRILSQHELYCTVCENNNGNCEIHNTVKQMKVDRQNLPFQAKSYPVDDSHPFYRYDPDQCILCGRCVEACQNLQVNETLSIDWEAKTPRVIWDGGSSIDESSCVSCGHCVTVCPCNALMEKTMIGEAGFLTGIQPDTLRSMIEITKEAEPGYRELIAVSDMEEKMRRKEIRRTKTVCTYCGVGCSFDIWTKGRDILKVEPQPEAPANGISTCVKGKFGWDFINSPKRLTRPLVRRGERFYETSWEEALSLAAEKFTEVKESGGPDALGFIASSKCTNEEAYLMQKLARSVIGTNNVDNCSRYCQTPATKGLFRTVGYGGDAGSIRDIAEADLVITVGSNTADSHPVLATRIKRAHKLHGQKLVVVDLLEHEMAERADLFLRPESSTDFVWLAAVTRYIVDQGWHDTVFIEERVNGLDDYVDSLNPFTLDYAESVTGIPREKLIRLAEMLRDADSTCILWAMGVTQHTGGSDTSTAISNLLLITGNYGRPGTGAYPLRGHNNVQGTSDFGALPNVFPGYESVEDESVRRRYEREWGGELPKKAGLDNHSMLDSILKGGIRSLYIIGEDTAFSDSNSHHVQEAFRQLDFMVVQDLFLTKTARFADVVLPASPSLEKEGTFVNTERRVQRLYQAIDPLGDSRPDWIILRDLARRLGADWPYDHPGAVMAEAAKLASMFAGVTYDRLEGYKSLQWPVAPDGTDAPFLYADGFPTSDGKARLVPMPWTAPRRTEGGYDLLLNNGRMLEHFHEGNMTYRSRGIRHKVPSAYVEVSTELAAERGIRDGARVKLVSPFGEETVYALVSSRVRKKELYLSIHTDQASVNTLTGSDVDRATHTPAYKEVHVRLETLDRDPVCPLPGHHPRYGRKNPQTGVEVERKWQREDYDFPRGKGERKNGRTH